LYFKELRTAVFDTFPVNDRLEKRVLRMRQWWGEANLTARRADCMICNDMQCCATLFQYKTDLILLVLLAPQILDKRAFIIIRIHSYITMSLEQPFPILSVCLTGWRGGCCGGGGGECGSGRQACRWDERQGGTLAERRGQLAGFHPAVIIRKTHILLY
jgi:hypothetical protein